MSNQNKICKVHYTVTLEDGTEIVSTYNREDGSSAPAEIICGNNMAGSKFRRINQIIDGVVLNLEVGQKIEFKVEAKDAFGLPNPLNIFTIDLDELPGAETLKYKERVELTDANGNPFEVSVVKVDIKNNKITFDADPEYVGHDLNFVVELVEASNIIAFPEGTKFAPGIEQ